MWGFGFWLRLVFFDLECFFIDFSCRCFIGLLIIIVEVYGCIVGSYKIICKYF